MTSTNCSNCLLISNCKTSCFDHVHIIRNIHKIKKKQCPFCSTSNHIYISYTTGPSTFHVFCFDCLHRINFKVWESDYITKNAHVLKPVRTFKIDPVNLVDIKHELKEKVKTPIFVGITYMPSIRINLGFQNKLFEDLFSLDIFKVPVCIEY